MAEGEQSAGVRTTDQLDAQKLHISLAALQRADNGMPTTQRKRRSKQPPECALSQGIPDLTLGLYRDGQAQLNEGCNKFSAAGGMGSTEHLIAGLGE